MWTVALGGQLVMALALGGCQSSPLGQRERCGNGLIDLGEECDDGNAVDGDGCSSRCTIEACGNGRVDRAHGEQCDDGNQADGDGCSADCMLLSCGNGVMDPLEECDDGNRLAGDGCSSSCTKEICGNGIFDRAHGEQCDDGNTIDGDGCDGNCKLPSCGDGLHDPFEQCDDGNLVDGDGCSSGCMTEVCGNGTFDRAHGEQCDDGNLVNGDDCEADCSLPRCGNTIRDRDEQCDDGNLIGNDGCENNCTRSAGVLPATCAEIAATANGPRHNGSYTLYFGREMNKPWTAYCAGMDSGAGREYLSLTQGDGSNFSQFLIGNLGIAQITYTKVRIDPITLSVDVADTLFAFSSGISPGLVPPPGIGYGMAMSCNVALPVHANINLKNTPFIVLDGILGLNRPGLPGDSLRYSSDYQVVDLTTGSDNRGVSMRACEGMLSRLYPALLLSYP
jgi:cysteine-rich repeat protein